MEVSVSKDQVQSVDKGTREFLVIQTSDEAIVHLPQKVALLSKTISNLNEDLMKDSNESLNTELCPIQINIDLKTLEDIIHYGNLFLENEKTMSALSKEEKEETSNKIFLWEQEFVEYIAGTHTNSKERDANIKDKLLNLILASNFLDIKPLMDFCSKMLANSIKGLTADEIIVAFGHNPKDFTKEFKETLDKENGWKERLKLETKK